MPNFIYLPARQGRNPDTNEPFSVPVYEHGYFETQVALEVWIEQQWDAEDWAIEKVAPARVLDPTPWEHLYREGTRAAICDMLEPQWRFSPRRGFLQDSADYAERGGVDPFGYELRHPTRPELIVKGRSRMRDRSHKTSNSVLVFNPREGYSTDESLYDPIPQKPSREQELAEALTQLRREYGGEMTSELRAAIDHTIPQKD